MALVVKDRVQETTTTTGTGTITLAGAVTGFQSFSVIGNANTTYYTIAAGSQWEVGIGTYTASGTTLSRDTILESSNAGSLVDFSAGTKSVFVTYPAEKSLYLDASNNAIGLGTVATTTTLTNATGLPLTTGVTGTLPIANGGTGTTSTTFTNLTTNVTGTLPVANGGTGAATLTANNVLLGNGTSAVTFVAPSTNGNVLTSNGSTWTSAAAGGGFPAGTRMSFQQTSAPTGWTKDTTAAINDAILRLVTGSVTSGGTTEFSTWNAQTATGATTLSTSQMPSHTHTYTAPEVTPIPSGQAGAEGGRQVPGTINTGSTGGGSSHTHSLTQSLKYYDFIIAAKD